MSCTPASPKASGRSIEQRLARLSAEARARVLAEISPEAFPILALAWRYRARPEQLAPPGNWRYWLIQSGRGFGKTRAGAEWVIEQVQQGVRRIALVAATNADVRDTMIQGESGIIACSSPDFLPRYLASKRKLVWPNGAVALIFSAEKPDRLRGPQHEIAWCDDLAAWGKNAEKTWEMLMFGMRKGRCQTIVTTTPKSTPLFQKLLRLGGLVVTRGRTYDNAANLSADFFAQIIRAYEGTRLGRQELEGDMLEDVPGALFHLRWMDPHRVRVLPEMRRIVVAIDPAITETEESDETGIVVLGRGVDDRLYVIADFTGRHSAKAWAEIAVKAFTDYKADAIVAETNRGGNMVRRNLEIEAPYLPIIEVTAARGKATRAEPVAHMYERGKVSHPVEGLERLEHEMTTWDPAQRRSPNGLDALVWGAAELFPFDGSADPKPAQEVADRINDQIGRTPGPGIDPFAGYESYSDSPWGRQVPVNDVRLRAA